MIGAAPGHAHQDAALRHAEYYLSVLKRANTLAIKKSGSVPAALNLLRCEWGNIKAAHNWLTSAHNGTRRVKELISLFAYQAANLFEHLQPPAVRIRWFTAARDAALNLQDSKLLGAHLDNLAVAYAAAGDSKVALDLYHERIELAKRLADDEGEASAECNLGTLLKDIGRPEPHAEESGH
jgi:tetratricopeptide (TPR) repeat protein